MTFQVPIDLTWRTLFSASLLVVGDAALVAMVRDAPVVLLLAILLSSFGAFWALYFEDWLSTKHPSAFRAVIGVCGVVFIGLAIFASTHAINEEIAKHRIKALYTEAAPFTPAANKIEEMPLNNDADRAAREQKIDQIVSDVRGWNEKTSAWLRDNLGETAQERFLDTSDLKFSCWTTDCHAALAREMNGLVNHKRNLSAILENIAVYNHD